MMTTPLTGIVPPLVTPLRDRDALDEPGLERLIEHVLGGGVSGLFILGTTGEGPSLSYRLRRELVARTCRQVNGRVPVLVGITDTAVVEALNLAGFAARAGAAALVAAPPYYLPGGQPELREYLGHLVKELPLPLLLYNMPALTKVPFDLETVRFAMDNPRIAGLKDSSGDMAYFQGIADLLPHRPDWTLLIGPEERLLDAVLAGGHGGVSGGANVFPALYVALVEACRKGDAARAFRLHAQVLRVSSSLYRIGRHPSAVIKGLKCALSCEGVCDDFMAEPFHRFRASERAVVEQRLPGLKAELRALGC
ncbi:MAG TPA: dihydrodipicolinate synthase family protein [Vicinamibacterales bacterium]|nr:dihydrodipicolinate synthase family protein [Vicinamibacterales bacterium]HPW21874.1 dihydrodipicolinate synthase family protein [Vicinamibacterales bacterium]